MMRLWGKWASPSVWKIVLAMTALTGLVLVAQLVAYELRTSDYQARFFCWFGQQGQLYGGGWAESVDPFPTECAV